MKNTRFIWRHMKGKRLLYGGAITCVALGTFIAIINPLILQVTIDSIIGNLPLEAPTWLEDRVGWIVNNDRLLEGLVLAGPNTDYPDSFKWYFPSISAANGLLLLPRGLPKTCVMNYMITCNTCPMIINVRAQTGISSSVVPLM